MQWPEWFGHFKTAINSKAMSEKVQLTNLKTLVSGKAKHSIPELAYTGSLCKDVFKILEKKFEQSQTVVGSHLEELSMFSLLKLQNSERIFSFASSISSLTSVLKSLSYDLKRFSVLLKLFQNCLQTRKFCGLFTRYKDIGGSRQFWILMTGSWT